jgi:hypothetical protein
MSYSSGMLAASSWYFPAAMALKDCSFVRAALLASCAILLVFEKARMVLGADVIGPDLIFHVCVETDKPNIKLDDCATSCWLLHARYLHCGVEAVC